MRGAERVTCRILEPDDRAAAVDLVADAIMELPAYRWLCGEALTAESARWLADVRCVGIDWGGVLGAFDAAGKLCGVAVLTLPGAPVPDPTAEQVEFTTRFVRDNPGFAERYMEMGRATDQFLVGDDCIDVAFAAVAPDVRMAGVLSALVLAVGALAVERGLSVVLRTTFPDHAEAYRRKWLVAELGSYAHPCGETVWVFRRDIAEIPEDIVELTVGHRRKGAGSDAAPVS